MSKDRHPPRQKPTEGETDIVIIRAIRRIDNNGIKVEDVCVGSGTTTR